MRCAVANSAQHNPIKSLSMNSMALVQKYYEQMQWLYQA
jgi:hypothetical protein